MLFPAVPVGKGKRVTCEAADSGSLFTFRYFAKVCATAAVRISTL